jgi:hypothetical protein
MSEAELPVLSLAIAAGCLAFATVLALSVEALVTGASSRPAHGSENEAVADKDAYDIFQVGTATKSGADVVAVVRGCLTEPTMLVSDETAEDGARIRRLRFFSREDPPSHKPDGEESELVSTLIQTEMLLCGGAVDTSHLRSEWHCLMVAALACADTPIALNRVLVLGHGAGALSSFLKRVLQCNVTSVDRSAAVASLARAHFADTARVHLKDAADFVLNLKSTETFHAVFLDLNASAHEPLAAPPAIM